MLPESESLCTLPHGLKPQSDRRLFVFPAEPWDEEAWLPEPRESPDRLLLPSLFEPERPELSTRRALLTAYSAWMNSSGVPPLPLYMFIMVRNGSAEYCNIQLFLEIDFLRKLFKFII